MTSRRPHWDDDLITAVCATGDDGEVDYWMTSDQVYRIIAAVEDWHKAKRDSRIRRTHSEGCWRWHNECAEALIVSQQAAIQRVQEEVGGDNPIPKASDGMDNVVAYCAGYVDALRRVRRALDGVRCGAGESEVYDHRCTLIQGHAGWHQDWRDGRLWAEWRETWRETLDGTDG